MMLQRPHPACLAVLTMSLVGLAVPAHAVIYGDDDRTEPYEVSDPVLRSVADSVAVVMAHDNLTYGGETFYLDNHTEYGYAYDLCPSERFWDQPVPGECSAFVVGSDTIVTSGNCLVIGLGPSGCADAALVFGFEMTDETTYRDQFDFDDVYFCEQILGMETSYPLDYAVIRVDRPIVGHPALPIRPSGTVEADAAAAGLYIIGHPAGLPLKIVGGPTAIGATGLAGATVKETFPSSFETNLDTYGGNNGSPVFSLDESGAVRYVEGLHAFGNADFVDGGGCLISNVCSDENGCPPNSTFEEVTRSTEFAHLVPPPCGDGLCGTAESCLSCPADCGGCETRFLEDFQSGLGSWDLTGGWIEADRHSEYPGYGSGSPVLSARMCDPPCTANVSTTFDLSDSGSAVVAFLRYANREVDSDDYLSLWFSNGDDWTLAKEWNAANSATSGWESMQMILPPQYLVQDFSLGFRARNDFIDEYIEIDDVTLFASAGGTRCLSSAECDDGLFCNGAELCDIHSGACFGDDPCPARSCDELNDECVQVCGDGLCDGAEAETCPEDCIDSDGDGWVDSIDNCPHTYNSSQRNTDQDPAGNACDCGILDPQAWDTPGEVLHLRLEQFAEGTILRWDLPIEPGGAPLVYDVLRSFDPSDFVSFALCVETGDGSDLEAIAHRDPLSGELFAFLVRAENSCPAPLDLGPLGQGVNGWPRTGRTCP